MKGYIKVNDIGEEDTAYGCISNMISDDEIKITILELVKKKRSI